MDAVKQARKQLNVVGFCAVNGKTAQGKEKTGTGMTKEKLIKSKTGRIVSKARSALAKKRFAASPLKKWIDAVKQARKQLNVVGFCAVNGKTAQGKALYAKVKSILGK